MLRETGVFLPILSGSRFRKLLRNIMPFLVVFATKRYTSFILSVFLYVFGDKSKKRLSRWRVSSARIHRRENGYIEASEGTFGIVIFPPSDWIVHYRPSWYRSFGTKTTRKQTICQWLPTKSGKSVIWCVDQWVKTRYFVIECYREQCFVLFHIYIHGRICDFSSNITHQILEICLLVGNQWAEMQLFILAQIKFHLLRPFYTYNNAMLSLFANNHMPNPDYQSARVYILTLIQQQS